MSNSALEDLITVVEWLSATKTPTVRVAEALERLKKRVSTESPNKKLPADKDGGFNF